MSRFLPFFLLVMLLVSACEKKRIDLDPAFQGFTDLFPETTVPLNISVDKEMEHNGQPLPPGDVAKYFGLTGDVPVHPVGKVISPGYVALLYYIADEMEYNVTAAFFDATGVRKSAVVIQNATNEISDRFAFVQQTAWVDKTITRKIEYHAGNGGDDPSHYVDVVTTINDDGTLVNNPESITPEGGSVSSTPGGVYDVELVEYRSPDLPGYELYVAYPFDESPMYLISHTGNARILSINENGNVPAGVALMDEEFSGLVPNDSHESESTGIMISDGITLIKKDNTKASFAIAMVKRSLTIGKSYSYGSDEGGTGSIAFTPGVDNTLSFIADVNTGPPSNHICQLEASMVYKANLAYYQGKPIDDSQENDCKLLFLFHDKSVSVFAGSGNFDCGCGANATLEGDYTQP